MDSCIQNTNIIYEDINKDYAHAKLGTFSTIIMKKNNYINATKLCNGALKESRFWFKNKTSKILIESLKNIVGEEVVIKILKGDKYTHGTYVHPKLMVHIAAWCNDEYAIRISDIIFMNTVNKTFESNANIKIDTNNYEGDNFCAHEIGYYDVVINKVTNYVNITKILRSYNKSFNEWHDDKLTKDYLTKISTDSCIDVYNLITVVKNAPKSFCGTYAHISVAVNIILWCNSCNVYKIVVQKNIVKESIVIPKISCTYLIFVGSVFEKRKLCKIDKSVSDNDIVAKYGKTKNLKKRFKDHKLTYGKIELMLFEPVHKKNLKIAEDKIGNYFVKKGLKIKMRGKSELVHFSDTDLEDIKEKYKRVAVKINNV